VKYSSITIEENEWHTQRNAKGERMHAEKKNGMYPENGMIIQAANGTP
jgi:hypothetical protein